MHMSGPEYDNWLTQRGAMQGATSPTMTMFDAYGHTYDLDNLPDKNGGDNKTMSFRRFGRLGSALGGQPPQEVCADGALSASRSSNPILPSSKSLTLVCAQLMYLLQTFPNF